MVSSVRLGKMEDRTRSSSSYHDAFETLFKRVMAKVGKVEHPLAQQPTGGKHLFLLLSADRGLCGAYNAHILKRLVSRVDEEGWEEGEYLVATVGNKGEKLATFKGFSLIDSRGGFSTDLPDEDVKSLLSWLTDGFLRGEFSTVEILYTKYYSKAKYVPSSLILLPFSTPEEQEEDGCAEWLFEPDAQVLAKTLVPMAVRGMVFRSLQEAMTSEQASRMMAMTQATDNAKDEIKKKKKLFNKLRQEAITSELMDIIGGAAAIE